MWTLHDGRGHLLPWGWAAAWLWRVAIQRICNPHIKPALHSLVFQAHPSYITTFWRCQQRSIPLRLLHAWSSAGSSPSAQALSRLLESHKAPTPGIIWGAHLVSGSEHQICTIYHMCYTTTHLCHPHPAPHWKAYAWEETPPVGGFEENHTKDELNGGHGIGKEYGILFSECSGPWWKIATSERPHVQERTTTYHLVTFSLFFTHSKNDHLQIPL